MSWKISDERSLGECLAKAHFWFTHQKSTHAFCSNLNSLTENLRKDEMIRLCSIYFPMFNWSECFCEMAEEIDDKHLTKLMLVIAKSLFKMPNFSIHIQNSIKKVKNHH